MIKEGHKLIHTSLLVGSFGTAVDTGEVRGLIAAVPLSLRSLPISARLASRNAGWHNCSVTHMCVMNTKSKHSCRSSPK